MNYLLFSDKNINNIKQIISSNLIKNSINYDNDKLSDDIKLYFTTYLNNQYNNNIFHSDIREQLIAINKLCIDNILKLYVSNKTPPEPILKNIDTDSNSDVNNNRITYDKKTHSTDLVIKDNKKQQITTNIKFNIDNLNWAGYWEKNNDDELYFKKCSDYNTIIFGEKGINIEINKLKKYIIPYYIDYVSIYDDNIYLIIDQCKLTNFKKDDHLIIKDLKYILNDKQPYKEDNTNKHLDIITFLEKNKHKIINIEKDTITIENIEHFNNIENTKIIGSCINYSAIPQINADITIKF